MEKVINFVKSDLYYRFVSYLGVFNIAQQFIECLQNYVGKEIIITAQTYDGASAMRFQAQGHIRSRLSAWGIYIYCRSHLLNLSVEDAIQNSMYDVYDTAHLTLVFLRDSPHRLQVLFESQKLINFNKKGKTFTNSVNYSISFLIIYSFY